MRTRQCHEHEQEQLCHVLEASGQEEQPAAEEDGGEFGVGVAGGDLLQTRNEAGSGKEVVGYQTFLYFHSWNVFVV